MEDGISLGRGVGVHGRWKKWISAVVFIDPYVPIFQLATEVQAYRRHI